MKKMFSKKTSYILIVILAIVSFYFIFKDKQVFSLDENYSKQITINDDGLFFIASTTAKTIGEFLEEKNITFEEKDLIFPDKDSLIFSGTNIKILRSRKFTFKVDGEEIQGHALSKNVGGVISENNITLGKLDKVEPSYDELATNDLEITITRINIEEKVIPEDISFETKSAEDSKLNWQEKKITQKGKTGTREVTYKITYKNGKEINREKTSSKITKEPVTQIETQGTYIKLGKKHTGLGTWYKQPDHLFWGSASGEGMYAANPWLPKGSYVKVVNKHNNNSVIVRINDRGPFGENRIIDLHTEAFKKLAPLGAGVIDVKMYEIEN